MANEESKRRSKPLFLSLTVLSAILMVLAYFAAKYYGNLSEPGTHAIVVLGIIAIATFMRRSLTQLAYEMDAMRVALARHEAAAKGLDPASVAPLKRPKSAFQSMTVRTALLMGFAYFAAKQFNAPPEVTEAILVVGIALIAVFLRRAVIQVFSERR